MKLADQIDKSAKARVNTYDRHRAHRIQGGNNWYAMSPLPEPQNQGYSLVALCTDISGRGGAYRNNRGQCHTAQDAPAPRG
jgi:hypothetical protein